VVEVDNVVVVVTVDVELLVAIDVLSVGTVVNSESSVVTTVELDSIRVTVESETLSDVDDI
jgi:hypothetical protein